MSAMFSPRRASAVYSLPTKGPLIRSIDANGITPEGLFQRLKGPFLFDGSMGGWFDGAHSLIGLSPFAVFQSKRKEAFFEFTLPSGERTRTDYQNKDPLTLLQGYLNRFKPLLNHPPENKPFPFLYGGAAGFIGYDLIQQIESIPLHQGENEIPDIHIVFINHFVLFERATKLLHIVYNPAPLIELGWNRQEAYSRGCQRIETTLSDMVFPLTSAPSSGMPGLAVGEEWGEKTEPSVLVGTPLVAPLASAYINIVERAKEYIAAGDIFQANLSHRFSAPFHGPSIFPLYQRLRSINPSPFAVYLNMGGIEMAGASPERLVRITREGDAVIIETRPIAGTRPRGKTEEEDQKQVAALYDSAKEMAEHLMLVDLERNDIGKVARIGTVKVDAMLTLEQYSHVSHLVSNIAGVLDKSVEATDAVRALFPGGTVTGVPKIRCMQIIAELEKLPRGLYTGSVGYFDFSGEIDMNIVIRTFIRCGNEIHFHVGAGIVADSVAEMEYQETLQKAAALLMAMKEVQ